MSSFSTEPLSEGHKSETRRRGSQSFTRLRAQSQSGLLFSARTLGLLHESLVVRSVSYSFRYGVLVSIVMPVSKGHALFLALSLVPWSKLHVGTFLRFEYLYCLCQTENSAFKRSCRLGVAQLDYLCVLRVASLGLELHLQSSS